MTKGTFLGEFEQLVLLALLRTGENAAGLEIHDEIVSRTGRDVSIPAVYVTLARLEQKGYVRVKESSRPRSGDRVRKLYTLTAAGESVLAHTRWALERMWQGTALTPRRGEP